MHLVGVSELARRVRRDATRQNGTRDSRHDVSHALQAAGSMFAARRFCQFDCPSMMAVKGSGRTSARTSKRKHDASGLECLKQPYAGTDNPRFSEIPKTRVSHPSMRARPDRGVSAHVVVREEEPANLCDGFAASDEPRTIATWFPSTLEVAASGRDCSEAPTLPLKLDADGWARRLSRRAARSTRSARCGEQLPPRRSCDVHESCGLARRAL